MLDIKVVAETKGGCQASSCGSSGDQLAHLPEAIREKVHNHPCYSEQAHHHYARMHVAVAPACNIQCNYCNRKYDCSNESRPGVVSEVLTPELAVKKVMAVASEIPQMTVVGIAGPGDALANPERTFETFRELARQAPDIKLCLSTNGLRLPEFVDALTEVNVDHVTITMNAVDPEVGARIYPWVFWNHRRVRGKAGAKILLRQQLKGLEMLAERGILVKVNSVMIPGVNDEHLAEVNRVVKEKGAFLHNIMPLISEAEHGTYYGLTGQRGPNPAELKALQDACAGDMNMMRHCRQCRADAVGLLGEDRGAEFTVDRIAEMEVDYESAMVRRAEVHAGIEQQRTALAPAQPIVPAPLRVEEGPGQAVLVAVASKGGGVINEHFGHAREFLVYEADANGVRLVGHRRADPYCSGADTCGENPLEAVIRALEGVDAVLCSRIGIGPWEALEAAGILPDVDHALDAIEEAIADLYPSLAPRVAERQDPFERAAG